MGGDGSDTASWAGSNAGVTVRLHDPAPRGGHAQGDSFGGTTTFTYRDKGDRVKVTLPDIENLTGSDYNDVLAGDQRANRISGGNGNDILYGGPGGDSTNQDAMYGDGGNDKVYGGKGDDSLYGGSGNDRLYGGPDDDKLYGGSGTDRLYGGDDDDVLDGGSGDDILEGGDGEDIFRFSQRDGSDDVVDFSTSRRERDRIDLSDFREIDSMDDLSIKQRGSHTRIDLDEYDGGEIWLLDIDKEDLDNSDFIFYRDGKTSGRDDDDDDRGGGGRTDPDPTPPPLTGAPGDDILYGGSGNDRLNGGKGDDVLYGGTGDDTLEGGPGVDSFEGGPGGDTIIVDVEDFFDKQANTARSEQDAIDGGEIPSDDIHNIYHDTLSFAEWVDTVNQKGVTVNLATRTVTHDNLTSTDVFRNIENIIGSKYDDDLTAGNGGGIIEGGDGADTLDGKNGIVSYWSSDGPVEVPLGGTPQGYHAAGDTLSNFWGIIGSNHDDTLTGDGSDNVIEGLAGADTLDGKGGTDILSYVFSPSAVQVNLNQGDLAADNTTRLIKTSKYGHAAGDKVTFNTFEYIIGSRYGDTLTGDNRANYLEGRAGNDTLNGDDGNDLLSGGPGNDTLNGGDDDDVLDGGPGADRLNGGNNTITGKDIASYESARAGVTLDLAAGRGRAGEANGDRFENIEKYVGSTGDDTFIASDDPDDIDGSAQGLDNMGDTDGIDGDTVSYEESTAGVTVNLGTSTYTGGYAAGDTLTRIENVTGSDHRDILTGDGNANVLTGGAGNDDLKGNDGADIFRFAGRHGNDDIEDFTQGEDKIDLSAFRNIASVEDLEDHITSGTDTEIDLSDFSGGEIELESFNHNTTPLTNDDFIFYQRPIGVRTTGDNKANILRGSAGNNKMDGRGGDDILYGGDGDDELTGGDGADTLYGGKGSDTFLITYETQQNRDTAKGEGLDLNEDGSTSTVSPDPDDQDTISYVNWDNDSNSGVTLDLGNNPSSDSTDVDGIENIIGSEHNDALTGDGGDNVIEGGDGGDTLNGGGQGGWGDTVSYRSSDGPVTVTLGGTVEGYHAASDNLSDFENIIGSRHADTLTGDGSNNVIEGLAGNDTLDGSTGTDTLSYEDSSGAVQVNLNQGDLAADNTTRLIKTSTGGHAAGDKVTFNTFEDIIGSRYGDTLTGDNRANTLTGRAGNDTLNGDDGNDKLYGGPGNDRLNGGDDDDVLDGGPGADRLNGGDNTITGKDIASYELARAGVTLDLAAGRGRAGEANGDTFENIEKYVGSANDDTFIASDGADDIDGGAHNGDNVGDTDGIDGDTVSYEKSTAGVTVTIGGTVSGGYAANDTLTRIENVTGSDHRDILTGDGNANVLTGGAGNDDLKGNDGADIFRFAGRHGNDDIEDFTQGEDKIDLSAFRNIASVEDLEDHIDTGTDTEIDLSDFGGGEIELEGFDTSGNTALTNDDFIFYSSAINGSSGNNTLKGDRRANEIKAGAGNDQLYGNAGDDNLYGEAGDDTLYGGTNNDKLYGGPGNDVLDGGPGADTFVFAPGNGDDSIMDFRSGTDKIDLSAFTTTPTLTDSITGDDNYTIDLGDDSGTITILGVITVDTSGDFIT